MEENTSRVYIPKWPASLEIQYAQSKKMIKSNTFPLRIRKDNEVRVFNATDTNGSNRSFYLDNSTCEVKPNEKNVQKNEDENIVREGGIPGKLFCSSDSKLLPNSISSPNLESEKYNCSDSLPVRKSTSRQSINVKSILAASSSQNGENNSSEQSYKQDLSSDETGGASRPIDSYSVVNSESIESTNSPDILDVSVHESQPRRPDRNSHRSTPQRNEAAPTQIQIDPSNNIRLPSPVEDALSIFNHFKSYQPTIGSAVFSILMTIIFVGILWIVVFTVFGPKGHAIAGIFLSIFILGFLLNTCFLKFYFRLRLFFGIEQLREQSIRAQNLANLEQQREDEVRQQRALEPPPSYSSVIESPPPYSIAKTMKPQQTDNSQVKVQQMPMSDMKLQQSAKSCVNHKETTETCLKSWETGPHNKSQQTEDSDVSQKRAENSAFSQSAMSTASCSNSLVKESQTLCASCKSSETCV